MSAIAQYLAWDRLTVTGSDRLFNSPGTLPVQKALETMGCRIFQQDGSGISPETEAVVLSTAIEDSNPDIQKARSLTIPLFHRSDILAALVASKKSIAVAGTSGKSTVAALLFHILHECGYKPSLITGANLHSLIAQGMIGNAYHGDSELLVVEADESDGTVVKYHPEISLFLNLSLDHKPVEEVLGMFKILAAQSSYVFANNDATVLGAVSSYRRFGIKNPADFSPDECCHTRDSVSLVKNGVCYTVGFPGSHVMENALAVLCVCNFLGCKESDIARAMASYKGIQRRFDRFPTRRDVLVIDDYAHNPEKIRATLKTTRALSGTSFVLFQPHGFGPTRFMLGELIAAFSESIRETDTLFLLPIYYAGGTASRDISSADIAKGLDRCRGTVILPQKREDAIPHIISCAQAGDIVISMGARDPSLPQFAQAIVHALDANENTACAK